MRRPFPSGMVRKLVLMIRRRKADDFDRTHDQIFRGPMPAEDDLAKSCPDRWGRFLAAGTAGGVLFVRARSRIARTRADFDRFSDISKNLETEMWSRRDLNPRPLRCERSALPAELLPHPRPRRNYYCEITDFK